ncbi:Voltage-dependent potassium channel beta subunit [Balamuthia mandrillaris]
MSKTQAMNQNASSCLLGRVSGGAFFGRCVSTRSPLLPRHAGRYFSSSSSSPRGEEVVEMKHNRLGSSGLKVSALSLGSWITFGDQLDEDKAFEIMKTAYDHGINFFDNAESYAYGHSEVVMGKILKRGGWRRQSLVLSTKLFWGEPAPDQPVGPNDRGLSRKHIVEGIHASLERMQQDYVDLLYCYRPDIETPLEETVRAMSHVVDKGLALYWGTSEWPAEMLQEAIAIARREHLIPPTMEQPEYNMLTRRRVERDYLPLYKAEEHGLALGLTTWSPLKYGILTGKYSGMNIPKDSRAGSNEWGRKRILKAIGEEPQQQQHVLSTVDRLKPIAEELDCSLAQLALAWCLRNPAVSSVITGASRPEQVAHNVAALKVLPKLSPEVLARIEALLDNDPNKTQAEEPTAINWRSIIRT